VSVLAVAATGRGLVAPHEPVIRADDEALLRGRAAFETLRVYSGTPFRLAEHVERLESSAERIGLPGFAPGAIEELAALALSRAQGGDAVLRLVWTGGSSDGPPTGLALLSEIPAWIEDVRARGARAVSLLGVRAAVPWLLPGVKSTSYAVNMAADAEAKRRGADEAIFVDADGVVLEGTVTNVWWRSGRTLYTPSLDLGILAGVTRSALVELAVVTGYEIEEGAYALDALLAAEEAFTSSSVREVMPVVEVDGRTLGRGPAADELQAALRGLAAPADSPTGVRAS
jgi:branched-subunit amino acid aminotransferase/4-amino-4-deoxychorismate lyase